MDAGGPVSLDEITKSFGEPYSHLQPLSHQIHCIAGLEFKFEEIEPKRAAIEASLGIDLVSNVLACQHGPNEEVPAR